MVNFLPNTNNKHHMCCLRGLNDTESLPRVENVDSLVQDCSNSSALAMELLQS